MIKDISEILCKKLKENGFYVLHDDHRYYMSDYYLKLDIHVNIDGYIGSVYLDYSILFVNKYDTVLYKRDYDDLDVQHLVNSVVALSHQTNV